MTFDRSKYKATSVAAAKKADEETAALTGQKDKVNADYINIPAKDKQGKKISGSWNLRIYPPHLKDGGLLYAVPKGVHWLPREVDKKDKQGNLVKDAKGNAEKEWKNRPVFNAKIHGGKKKDLVEEYVAFANKIAKETFPETEKGFEEKRKEFMAPINGGYGSEYDGILLRQTWVMYVDQLLGDTKNFGKVEIGRAVKERLNKIAATESAGEPLGTDPFTDLEDGRAITISYDASATKAQDYYSTEIYAPLVPGAKGQIKLFPLSDDDMIKFEEYPSLKEMFTNVYDSKTFHKIVLPGLKKFDDDFELGIFGYDEWLDIVEELAADYPESEADGASKSDEEEEDEKSGDQFDKMDRDELKEFNRTEKLGIIVNKNLTDDDFRDQIRKTLQDKAPVDTKAEVKKETATTKSTKETAEDKKDLPWEKEEVEGKEDEQPTEQKTVKSSVTSRLDKLKGKKA